MATGFRCFDDTAANALVTDMTVRFSQNMGYVDTNGVNGSVTVSDAPNGRNFFYFVVGQGANANGDGLRPGVLTTDNGATVTITWTYSFTSGYGRYALPVRIHYGYY